MMVKRKCVDSGKQADDRVYQYLLGGRIECCCGKIVKLREPLNKRAAFPMIPHHNEPSTI